MKWIIITFLILVALIAGCWAGYWFGHRAASSPATTTEDSSASTQPVEDAAVPMVRVSAIAQQKLTRSVLAYGTVIAQPGDIQVISVPFESRVNKVLVTPGQRVANGDDLVDIAPSTDTQLQLSQSKAALISAREDLAQTQARFNNRLATNQDLLQSQQTLDQAQLKFDALQHSGATGVQQLKSDKSGIVSKIDIQDGQIVPGGGPLIELVAENRIEVKLNVEPDDARKLKKDQSVQLSSVHSDNAAIVQGTILMITERVNPDTRLVDVFVSLPKEAGMLLEGFVSAKILIDSEDGLVVPRDAVLKDDDDFVLYTVKDDHAIKHKVTIELETDSQVLIKAEDIKAGDLAVILGNYELENGMAVTTEMAQASSAPKNELPPDLSQATRVPALAGALH